MDNSAIYAEPTQVELALKKFGISVEELQDVALVAASARNEASPLHPANAPGTFSYMQGVAALRMAFLPKDGWEMKRTKGVESVENRQKGLVILFQNVDHACGSHDPIPISSKGDAITKMVDSPTEYLWPHMKEEDAGKENLHIWFFCVSSDGEDVRAELSRPSAIKNKSFGVMAERIFILQESDFPRIDEGLETSSSDDDFDVPVSRK